MNEMESIKWRKPNKDEINFISRSKMPAFPPLSNPQVIRLCQAMEYSGGVSLALHNNRLSILPSKRTPDGTLLWAEMSLTAESHVAIADFPISLFCKLQADTWLEDKYQVSFSTDTGVVCIQTRDTSVQIECEQCKVCPVPAILDSIPKEISTPDIMLQFVQNPSLAKLHSRLARMRKGGDGVLVSANAQGSLIFTANVSTMKLSVTFDGLRVCDCSERDDRYRLFGVQVAASGLLRVLRGAGCGVEQMQVAITHRSALLIILITREARITALIPHVDY